MRGLILALAALAMTPFPTANAAVSRSVQMPYIQAFIAACIAAGVPYVDEWTFSGSWEAANTASMTQDNYHPNSNGVWKASELIAKCIMSI